jgi:hypothetical protein
MLLEPPVVPHELKFTQILPIFVAFSPLKPNKRGVERLGCIEFARIADYRNS